MVVRQPVQKVRQGQTYCALRNLLLIENFKRSNNYHWDKSLVEEIAQSRESTSNVFNVSLIEEKADIEISNNLTSQ